MQQKVIFGLKILIILSIIALTALIYFEQGDFTSLDLGRHLENGKIVWSQPGVLFSNFYSYTEPNLSFINHHWLSGVIFYLLYLIGGFKILTLGLFKRLFYDAPQKPSMVSPITSLPKFQLRVQPKQKLCLNMCHNHLLSLLQKIEEACWHLSPLILLKRCAN